MFNCLLKMCESHRTWHLNVTTSCEDVHLPSQSFDKWRSQDWETLGWYYNRQHIMYYLRHICV